MASSRWLAHAWVRWFGSGPHIIGLTLGLICMLAGHVGAVETILRQRFDELWWALVPAAYVVGALGTAVILRYVARLPWRVAMPPADPTQLSWLARQWLTVWSWIRRLRATGWVAGSLVGLAVVGLFVGLTGTLGVARAATWITIISGFTGVVGLLLAWLQLRAIRPHPPAPTPAPPPPTTAPQGQSAGPQPVRDSPSRTSAT